jgi:IS605 OrfB family transposase
MITKYDGFVLEDLNIQGMLKNHCLAKAISDAGWYEYKRQLLYKAEWAGKPVIEIGRFEPSSKTCSCCGWYDKDLTLADREFVCQECSNIQDRDLNAAINIRNIGMKTVGWDCIRTGELVSRTAEDDKRFMPQGRCLSKNQQKECSGLNELVSLN